MAFALRGVLVWLACVFGMAVTATIVQTQFVISALKDVGATIGFGDRISMTLDDLLGFGPLYAAFIAIGFALAFFAAWLVRRLAGLPAGPVYAVAGGVCMWVMLFLMEQVFFGVPVIAGARTAGGVAAQMALGALWGWLFAAWVRGRS